MLLGACGSLPRPFQPDMKAEDNPLLILPDRGGVVVRTVAGLDDGAAGELAERLADALRRENVVASTSRGNAASFTIDGTTARASDGAPMARLALRDGTGAVVKEEVVRLASPSQAGGLDLAAAAKAAAAAFAPAILPPIVAAALPSTQAIKIGQIRGAPGEGGTALVRALDYALRRTGTKLADAADPEALAVDGEMRIAPKGARMRSVAVVWTVRRPDGSELGQVRQENDVPADLIDRAWAELAAAVAEGAADGIADLLERATPLPQRRP